MCLESLHCSKVWDAFQSVIRCPWCYRAIAQSSTCCADTSHGHGAVVTSAPLCRIWVFGTCLPWQNLASPPVLQGCDQHRLPPSEMLETGASRAVWAAVRPCLWLKIILTTISPLITVALRAHFAQAPQQFKTGPGLRCNPNPSYACQTIPGSSAQHRTRTRCLERGNSTCEDTCKQVGCAKPLGQKLHGILQSESPWAKDTLFRETVSFLACGVVSLAWGSLNKVCCIV